MTAPEIRHREFCTDPTMRQSGDVFDRLRTRWRCLGCGAEAIVTAGPAMIAAEISRLPKGTNRFTVGAPSGASTEPTREQVKQQMQVSTGHRLRRWAGVDGYAASCSCGWRTVRRTRDLRDREADAHEPADADPDHFRGAANLGETGMSR